MKRLFKLVLVAVVVHKATQFIRNLEPREASKRRSARPPLGEAAANVEPVLGYDGMDLQTLVPWLESANLDRATLRRIRDYESRHQARQTVLQTVDDLLG